MIIYVNPSKRKWVKRYFYSASLIIYCIKDIITDTNYYIKCSASSEIGSDFHQSKDIQYFISIKESDVIIGWKGDFLQLYNHAKKLTKKQLNNIKYIHPEYFI